MARNQLAAMKEVRNGQIWSFEIQMAGFADWIDCERQTGVKANCKVWPEKGKSGGEPGLVGKSKILLVWDV